MLLNKTKDSRLEASLPVDGDPEVMTSYRTGLYGILTFFLATKVLVRISEGAWIQGKFYCDNEQVVKRVNKV